MKLMKKSAKSFKQFLTEKKESGWIGVDLDGTLAYYTEWKGIHHIGDPIPEMLSKVKKAIKQGKKVKIFTARVANGNKAIKPIEKWCEEHIGQILPVTNVKDMHCKEIWDDRAKQVRKNKGEFVK